MLVGGRGAVDHDLMRPLRPASGYQRDRVEAALAGVDAEAEGGRAARSDRLAVASDELDVVEPVAP
jgi:hypothetical protein